MLRTTDSTVDTGVQTGATVTAGAFDIGVQAGSKGAVDVDGGTLSIYGTLSVGDAGTGALDVSGATVTTAFLNVGALGSVTLAAGGTIEAGGVHVSGGSEIKLAGGALDPPAPVTIDAGGTIDGYGTLFGDVENNGLLLAEGGAVDISGAVTGDGILDIESGGTLVLSGTVAASQTISFSGSGALQLEPGAEIDTALNDLAVGDMIEVLGTSVSSVMFGASSLTITTSDGPITFSDVVYASSPLTPDAYSASYDKSTGLEDITFTEVTCYVEGTKILTSRGEVAVESLRIGDSLKTLHAGEQKIKWIGTRSYGGRFIEGNKAALPICIKRNAIENNIPARDLFVSPGHAICIDGVLVRAARLVNGVSVVQAERVSSVTYYHIEMETHEIIFAENCPAETFIGEHFRQQFQNAAAFKELYPGEAATETTCLPRLDSGFQLHAIQQRIAARAGIDISAAPVQGPLRGYVDQAGPKLCCGWVQDILAPEEPVCLDITADGRTIGRVLANLYRADLYQAGYGSGYHGFEVLLPPGIKGRIDAVRTADRAALAWTETAAARAA
jgi:T5SS/PEP-CTERM-associated repeat protein